MVTVRFLTLFRDNYNAFRMVPYGGPIENVPNAGCRASLQISQQYPFVQWPEVAANPEHPDDDQSVKLAVPDGSLCAAGDKRKIGLDAPQNAGWKMTDVESGKPIQLTHSINGQK